MGSAISTKKERRDVKLKYIVFWKYCPEDVDKIREKVVKAAELGEKEPENWGKYLFPPCHMGYCKGFSLVEITDPMQLARSRVFWFPEMSLEYVPITENTVISELYQQMKK